MALIGLDMLYTGLKNEDGSVIVDATTGLSASGVYALDTNKAKTNLGTQTANLTNLSGTPTKINGNNEVVDVTNPPSSPQAAITSNGINYEVLQKLLGRQQLDSGAWVDDRKTTYAGLIIASQEQVSLKRVYFCFGMGTFNQTTQNVQTNTDTAETRETDSLTYNALGYSKFDGQPFAVFYESDPKFDKKKMFDLVFPGQTFVSSSSDGTQDASLHGGTSTTVSTPSSSTTGR